MSGSLRFDAGVLYRQANKLLDHVAAYRQDHVGQDTDLSNAASAWSGDIGSALEEVRTGWAEQHEVVRKHAGEHATWIMEATTKVSGVDEVSAGRIGNVGDEL